MARETLPELDAMLDDRAELLRPSANAAFKLRRWADWRLRGLAALGSAALVAGALALAVRRGGLSRIDAASAESKEAAPAAPAAFTCAKYGCLDIKSANACQCAASCEAEGTCCADYRSVCEKPGRHEAALGVWGGCPPGAVPPPPEIAGCAPRGAPLQVKVVSYNPEWWHTVEELGGYGNKAAQLLSSTSRKVPYDFIGFQEFYDPWYGLTRPGFDGSALLREYMWVRGEVGGPVGTIIGFRNSTWDLIGRGQRFVAEDRKGPMYFGKRIVLWARFAHKATGKTVFVADHHGPLPVSTGGICGGQRTAVNVLTVIAQSAKPGDAVILVGDFNAIRGSETIRALSSRLHGTFDGIDHIFTNLGPQAIKWQGTLGTGGSDHPAVSVVVELPGER